MADTGPAQAAGPDGAREDDWAICCSGGGIRSAAYCLGALQSLEKCGLLAKVKWILGVSGGSYIASSRAMQPTQGLLWAEAAGRLSYRSTW
ncbi:MAG TPA: hypothetical protein VF933_15565, partial [Streptosporangiaceae bacterium]